MRRLIALVMCAAGALPAGCGVLPLSLSKGQDDTQPPIDAPGAILQAATAPSQGTSSNRHAYVADPGSGAIYRYALVNGLPQSAPDETFAKVPNAHFLGVDEKGNIYAAGPTSSAGFVREFSPNGKLVGKATLGISIGAFAVGAAGFFYASSGNNQAFTYAPTALHRQGVAKPIAMLTAEGSSNGPTQFVSMAEDVNGRLYAAAFGGINVYYHPHRSSSENFTIALPKVGWGPYFGGAVAFDQANRVYANVQYLGYCGGRCRKYQWRLTDFYAISGLGHRREDRWILAKNCYANAEAPPGRISGDVTGMAVFDGYIEAACTDVYGSNTSVWVYHADEFGVHQQAVETLGGLVAPSDVKIGP
jgi:hypothetical protein